MKYYRKKRIAKRRFRPRTAKPRPYPIIHYDRYGGPDALYWRHGYSNSHVYATDQNIDRNFRLNSLYDPDYTGAGRTAMWHDQIQVLYRRYKVYKVVLEITVYNKSQLPYELNIAPYQYAGGDSTVVQQSKTQLGVVNIPVPGAGGPCVKRKIVYDLATLAGLSHEQYMARADYGSTTPNDNPSNSIFLSISGAAIETGDNNYGCLVSAQFMYFTKWTEQNGNIPLGTAIP